VIAVKKGKKNWMGSSLVHTVLVHPPNPQDRTTWLGAQDVLDRIAAGEPVSPSQYYFRTTPRFSPPDGQYDWLKKSIFLGDAERHAELVILRVWKVA